MKIVDYEDERGRRYRVELPDDASESEAEYGIPVGPPNVVDALDIPEPLATRLHNELHRRELWSEAEVKKNPKHLLGALQAVLNLDVQKLRIAYMEVEREVHLDG